MGRNKYTSLKQRYLNSGYAIGPVSDMRRLWRRAQEKVDSLSQHPDWDNGSHGADFMYHGSDQSIFNSILGEQEFQREIMRRRHRTADDQARGTAKDPLPTRIEGTLVDDPINPSFTHEPMEAKEGKPDEFGIGLDYFSELGHQTANAEDDARYIRYSGDVEEQANKEPNGLFDCPRRVSKTLPHDIDASRSPIQVYGKVDTASVGWSDVPLYTNTCLNKIVSRLQNLKAKSLLTCSQPVMIHHNGNKDARQFSWPWTWMQPHSRKVIEELMSTIDPELETSRAGGAFAGESFLGWNELCPKDMESEIFRDL